MGTAAGHDRSAWPALVCDLGLPGDGRSWLERALALEETGRALLCAPYVSAVLAAEAAVRAGAGEGDGRGRGGAQMLAALARGELVAALALAERGSGWDRARWRTVATATGAAYRLEGHKDLVVDGLEADVLVVAARTEGGGTGLFLVEADASGLTRASLPSLDPTRRLARLELSATPAHLLAGARRGRSSPPVDEVLDRAALALAAEALGGAQWCFDTTVAHVRERAQFGRPLGGFQAVKHRCADLLVDVEAARSLAWYAAWAADHRPGDLPTAAPAAKARCSEVYLRLAGETIQLLGAVGFTWDHDAQLHLKRAASSWHLFGDPAWHRQRIARALTAGAGASRPRP